MPRADPATLRRAAYLAALVLLLASALFFPRTGAAGLALAVLMALAGGLAWSPWGKERAARLRALAVSLPAWTPDALVVVVVVNASIFVYADTWFQTGLRMYDWGPHHANLKNLIDGLARGGVPRWVQGVSTGDSPYELYPLLPYWLMARAALLFGTTDLTLVLVRTAVLTHTLAALGGGLLARRTVGAAWGVVVGLVMLLDHGSVWGGGAEGIFKLGVLHSALANAVFPFVLVAVVAALRRPTLVTSAAIWSSVALAVACHPLALTSALATCGALVLVACFARDVPAARALACAAHVALGVALVAAIFMPLNARLLSYGVHFGIGAAKPWEQFGTLLAAPIPQATFGPFVAAGYLGIVAALISRRGALVLLAGMAALLLFFLLDQPYLLFDAAPSPQAARFQTVRLASASKAAVYVLGSYALSLVVQRARAARPARGGLVLAAALTFGLAFVVRGGLPFLDRQVSVLRVLAHTDVPDEDGL
ncbi:MAG TPA: hypothetical protein VGQ57_20730, partial [Polyangiaceae bacterium]|nr:hypothetical protein [Polyangiaceae bacterium]